MARFKKITNYEKEQICRFSSRDSDEEKEIRKQNLEKLINDFGFVSYHRGIVQPETYLLRLLYVGNIRRRLKWEYEIFDEPRLLFDHVLLFKNKNGEIFLFSTPYAKKEDAQEDFNAFVAKHSSYGSKLLTIKFFDEDYRFIKNGSIMLMICKKRYLESRCEK